MESKTDVLYDVSDDEAVYMISENNEDAKDYLFQKYSGMIHKELNSVKKSAFALGIEYKDLVQEAMLGFSNAISSYNIEEDTKFSTYATLCVKRKLLNYIDKYRTQKSFNMQNAVYIEGIGDKNGHDYFYYLKDAEGKEPLNKLITNERLSEVSNLFGTKLNAKEKMVVEYIVMGLSVEEIAQKTEMNAKQVYNVIYRARQKLKID